MRYIIILLILSSCYDDSGLKEAKRLIKESEQRFTADSLAIDRKMQLDIERIKFK